MTNRRPAPAVRHRVVLAVLAAAAVVTALVAPPAAAAEGAWRDDFTRLDTSVWDVMDWGCFSRSNVGVQDGLLWLRIVPDPANPVAECEGVTGARITTKGLRDWPAGTFSARIRFVTVPGSWQTFWLTGANGLPAPGNGEVDIAEITGKAPRVAHHRLHSSRVNAPLKRCSQGADKWIKPDGVWRTYSATTGARQVVFRVDGQVVGRYQPVPECTWPFGDRMRILFSARGGRYGGAVDVLRYPVTYHVDWVSWEPAA
jgi:hypothetical protein